MKLDKFKRLELITEAVLYCQHVSALGMPRSCFSKALREPIFFLWESYGKTKIQSAKYRSLNSIGYKYGCGDLVYDHSIPFRILQEKLLEVTNPEPSTIQNLLDKYLVSCIITNDENRILNSCNLNNRMPPGWDGTEQLARYIASGISVDLNIEYLTGC